MQHRVRFPQECFAACLHFLSREEPGRQAKRMSPAPVSHCASLALPPSLSPQAPVILPLSFSPSPKREKESIRQPGLGRLIVTVSFSLSDMPISLVTALVHRSTSDMPPHESHPPTQKHAYIHAVNNFSC